jgi:hypothetical protein
VKPIKPAVGIQTFGGDYHKCESTFRPRTVGSNRDDAISAGRLPAKSKQKQRSNSKK